jgi:outer membrane receptor for ferrienterochelin and colicins
MKRSIYIFWAILSIQISIASAGLTQRITGRVVDENNSPLAGAAVSVEGTVLGAATDLDGYFVIEKIPPGQFTLKFTMLGYRPVKKTISLAAGEVINIGTVKVEMAPVPGEAVVVTAAKYEQKMQDVPVSLSLIDRRELQMRNIVTIDQALQYVPGVNMNSSQMNIRGSSGYSRGVGSRVLFLLDGIPFMTGDTREISYEALPTYMIERVEVMKGAGSALYGSSALGGVVNIITRDIDASPFLYVKLYQGLYSNSTYDQWNWSSKRRFFNGFSGLTSHKMGKFGFQMGGAYAGDDSYRQNDTRKRYSVNARIQWWISPYEELILSGNYMHQDRENFLYWQDLDHALQPAADQLGDKVTSIRRYINGQYRYLLGSNRFLTIRGIWFRNQFTDNITAEQGNKSTSHNLTTEIQYSSRIRTALLTLGTEGTLNKAESNIFGEHSGNSVAGYLQLEMPLTSKWRITGGARADYFYMDSVKSETQINPKLGITFSPAISTTFRASFGLGFRAPSLAEVFTSTTASGFQIIPNINLRPEQSTSFETGLNHNFGERFNLDVAYFYNRYRDLIEGEFLESGQVQFQNITRAEIQGGEVDVSAQLVPDLLRTHISYTYVNPWDLDSLQFLRFRPRHLFYLNNQLTLGKLQLFLDYRYIKKYDRIDEKFLVLIPDAEKRVDAHIVDVRAAIPVQISRIPLLLTLQINNLLQYYYVDLIGSLAPLRNFTLTLETGF